MNPYEMAKQLNGKYHEVFEKANKEAAISRMNILDECEKEGITIVEYTKRLDKD